MNGKIGKKPAAGQVSEADFGMIFPAWVGFKLDGRNGGLKRWSPAGGEWPGFEYLPVWPKSGARNFGSAIYASKQFVVYKGGTYGSLTDEPTWTREFRKGAIVRRECATCLDSHKDIWYVRLTPTTGINPYYLFVFDWMSADNTLNQDFKLYSSLDDLRADRNPWQYCNYDDPGVGFPRDCGPAASVSSQWTSGYGLGQTSVRFTIYVKEMSTTQNCTAKMEEFLKELEPGWGYSYSPHEANGLCDPIDPRKHDEIRKLWYQFSVDKLDVWNNTDVCWKDNCGMYLPNDAPIIGDVTGTQAEAADEVFSRDTLESCR